MSPSNSPTLNNLILFNKPYGILSQFTDNNFNRTLSKYIPIPGFYAAGRLDADSEGLLLLTNNGLLQQHISNPRHKLEKIYWAQVEGVPTEEALAHMRLGINLKEFRTRPCQVTICADPAWVWPRTPPVRFRKNIPTSWLKIILTEGKNRQVRRMTAAIGYPTLRLIRSQIGDWKIDSLAPGEYRLISVSTAREALR